MIQPGIPPRNFLENFDIPGRCEEVAELKRGHINRTFLATWNVGGHKRRYIHQTVNHAVFPDVQGLMRNLEAVTDHIKAVNGSHDQTLSVIKTRNGDALLHGEDGEYWRCFEFIENTDTFDVCPSPEYAKEAGAILGRFQRGLLDLSPHSLCETIPGFHDGAKRFAALREAIERDAVGRVASAGPEISFALESESVGRLLIDTVRSGRVPWRVTHNDMKLNNVLFERPGGRAIALVDLDTCMAGTVLFDFGDFVRSTAVPCEEDERDHSKVRVDLVLFDAICRGYIDEARSFLSEEERELLAIAPRVFALVLGVRFLTDYLNGDVYFRTDCNDQNLARARTQLAIFRAMKGVEGEMEQAVQRAWTGSR